ncbi:MAG: hypothetical protein A2V88_00215 [Elusimicrobia bacterium RBG_16_66_12]|nr:MAG: hypothetical protein A2V88_00215 [Elusimicrobia bacterium RBG_16_66_12]
MTAEPSSGSPSTSSELVWKVVSIVPKDSRWSGPMLVSTPRVGSVIWVSSAISPFRQAASSKIP